MVADVFLMSGCQQSNSGYGDWNATGGSSAGAAGADFGFGINNTTSVFPAVTLWKRFAQAPAATAGSTQTYTVADYQGTLKAYGAAGTTNMGHEQSLGRALIEWGIATAPFLQDEAVAGSSIVTHWNQTTVWPGIYTNAVTRAIAAKAAAGINPTAVLHRQGETDTSTTSGNLTILADGTYFKAWYNRYFSDVGIPNNTPIIVFMVNSAQTGANTDVPGYRAAQLAWKAIDPRVILIDMDDVPLHADPHFDMCGQFSAGFRIAVVLAGLLGKTVRRPPAGSTTPFWRYDEPCFSCEVSPGASQPRSSADPQVGDVELLALWSYSAVVTHVMATAAGFAQIGAQVDSAFSGTIHKAQSLYWRSLNESHFYVDGSGRRRTITPSFTIGTATLGIGKIIGTYSNVDPVNPINAFAFGTQTVSALTHTVPTITTTKPGCLVVLAGSDNGTNCSNSGLTNGALTSLTQRRDGRVNPGAGQVGYWTWDGVLSAAGAVGTSTATFTVASVATSLVVALNPANGATITTPIGGDTIAMAGSQTSPGAGIITAAIGADTMLLAGTPGNRATIATSIGAGTIAMTGSQAAVLTDGIDWATVRLAVRDWIVAGAKPYVAANHVIWAGSNHPIPNGVYITLAIGEEDDFGFDRTVFDDDGTEHAIGDRTVEVTVTVYGGVATADATLPWRIASRTRAAVGLTAINDLLVAANVGVMSWSTITTPGRGINSAIFEPRAMFTAVLSVVSDLSVAGVDAGTTITSMHGTGKVDTVDSAVVIPKVII